MSASRRFLVLLLSMLASASAFAADPASMIPPIPPPLDFPLPVLHPPGKDFLITDFGAVADGQTLNTAAIQKAIDTCSATGGGTVVIPVRHIHLRCSLFLKKDVNLRVEKEGILKGSTNPADYPIIDTRFEGIERPFMAAFINVIDLDGITVSGEGTIDGSGEPVAFSADIGGGRLRCDEVRARRLRSGKSSSPIPPSPPVQTTFTAPRTVLTATATPPALTLVGAGSNRPRLICFTNCTNTAIKDLTLQNQAVWCLHILYCTDFLADNLNIKDPTHRIPSSDGIDIDSSRRVRINKVTIDVNDDCISIKSGKDADGRRVNRPCEDILVVNSHMAYGQGGVAMGSEVSGMIRNVEIRDTFIDSDNWAPIRFKSQPTRGGTVENIRYYRRKHHLLNNTTPVPSRSQSP